MRRLPFSAACLITGALAACADDPPLAFKVTTDFPVSRCGIGQAFNLESSNPWFPIDVGRQWIYEGKEKGALLQLTITVLDATERVGGINTRIVREEERADGELIERSHNYFAVTSDGTVCYFGEDVDIYEGGVLVSHEGAWRADDPGNFPGVIMPPDPEVGLRFLVEGAPGIAEDEALVTRRDAVEVTAGSFPEAIRIRDSNPLDHSVGVKVFALGVGLVIDGPVELISYSGGTGGN